MFLASNGAIRRYSDTAIQRYSSDPIKLIKRAGEKDKGNMIDKIMRELVVLKAVMMMIKEKETGKRRKKEMNDMNEMGEMNEMSEMNEMNEMMEMEKMVKKSKETMTNKK